MLVGQHSIATQHPTQHQTLVQIYFVKERIKKNISPIMDPTLKNKGKLFKKSDWKPEMLKTIYVKYNDKIVDLYLDGKINSPLPSLKKITL